MERRTQHLLFEAPSLTPESEQALCNACSVAALHKNKKLILLNMYPKMYLLLMGSWRVGFSTC